MKSISDDRQVPQQRYSPDNPNDKSTSRKFRHALALTIISLSLKMYAHNSLSHRLHTRKKKTNMGWENWKTNRCIFHRDRACSANPPQIQKSIFLAIRFVFRCGRSRSCKPLAFTCAWQICFALCFASKEVHRTFQVMHKKEWLLIRKNFIKVYYTL